ncbi:gas vesicle protein [Micromonospora sp. CPCC 206060]|uniref:gas vesicle protein n=1 Tax=Micromonospora sp. CPCC 206060 TaxID=3122406 RepID=UPI002FF19F9B
MTSAQQSPAVVQNSGQVLPAGHEPANLGDILERVLDRGIIIAGDIRVSLLDIELLTLKLRLVIASVDTARQMGIDWWEHDPFLSSRPRRPVEPEPLETVRVRPASVSAEDVAGRAGELDAERLTAEELTAEELAERAHRRRIVDER